MNEIEVVGDLEAILEQTSLEPENPQEVNTELITDNKVDKPQGSTKPEVEAPKEVKVEVPDNVKKNAQYFMRNPEAFDQLIGYVKELRDKDPAQKALKEVLELRLENARKDIIIEYKLTKADMRFIHGNTADELQQSAKEFTEYKQSLGKVSEERSEDSTTSFNQLPKYNKSPKEKLVDIEDWFKNNNELKF